MRSASLSPRPTAGGEGKFKKFRSVLWRYRHSALLLYMLIYFPWFNYLEDTVTKHFHVIHMRLDDMIPFMEIFVIPYMLWFAYVAAAIAFFLIVNKNDYYKLCLFLFTGMTLFLIISTVYPNGHLLRPLVFERDNIFVDLVKLVYASDTPTNLFPSIHVYNSIGVNIAVQRSAQLQNKKGIRLGSHILCVLIVLSTMFIKQHSVFDVLCGIVLSVVMYALVYDKAPARAGQTIAEKLRRV